MRSIKGRPLLAAIAAAALAGSCFAAGPLQAQPYIGVQVRLPPPALPIYVQPAPPAPDYIWTPGYWAWDPDYSDYYWVPGVWVPAPEPGYLWTPGYWGWSDGVYVFHDGYWGPHIGYYGGVAYGFGYTGAGFEGGYWRGSHYYYNSAVNNVSNASVTNVYSKTVIINRIGGANVSYSGGPGGVVAQPTPAQMAAANEPHLQPTPAQAQHAQAAQGQRSFYASANHGAPPVLATAAPARFEGQGIVRSPGAGAQRPTYAPGPGGVQPQREVLSEGAPLRGASPPQAPGAPAAPSLVARPQAPPRSTPPPPKPPKPPANRPAPKNDHRREG